MTILFAVRVFDRMRLPKEYFEMPDMGFEPIRLFIYLYLIHVRN